MTDFEDILARAKARETSVDLCLAGDLLAEHERLSGELERVSRDYEASRATRSLADADPAHEIAEQIRDLEERITEQTVSFRFRAIPRSKYRELESAHPGRPDKQEAWNPETFAPALIAACSLDPKMSDADVHRLMDHLNAGQAEALFEAAWTACNEAPRVPFSAAASALTRSTAGR